MSDPATLVDFVKWAIDLCPADRYTSIIWGHGAGWKGVGFDLTDNDALYMGELRQAPVDIKANARKKLELIGFMSCLMGMTEVAYQVAESVDVMVASEELMWVPDWEFDTIVNNLEKNPMWNQKEFATDIVTVYGARLRTPADTLSAINLNPNFLDLVRKVSDFADEMLGKHARDEREVGQLLRTR